MKISKLNSSIGKLVGLKKRNSTEKIIIHSSATLPTMNESVFDIHQWHLERGWSAIGYHVFIERSGAVRLGRPLDTVGAHCKGHNSYSIGVCMSGGLAKNKSDQEDNFTKEQYASLQSVLLMLSYLYPDAEILKHKDLADTKCNEVDIEKLNKRIYK